MASQPRRQQPGMACEECRRKRIRCNRGTPQCSACVTSGATCVVRDSCPPRGPKKGYLKTLQEKIEDLQNQLEKQQEVPVPTIETTPTFVPSTEGMTTDNDEDESYMDSDDLNTMPMTTPMTSNELPVWSGQLESPFPVLHVGPWECNETSYFSSLSSLNSLSPPFPAMDPYLEAPKQTSCNDIHITPMMHNDLDQLFFDRAYVFAPIVQAQRYRAWSKQPNKSKQRTCLQYAMWTLASSLSGQFQVAGRQLYATTRLLLQGLESEELCHQISLEQAQAWTLLAIYELTSEDYHRGLMSAGRAFRLIQMMRLYEIDGPSSPMSSQTFDQGMFSVSSQLQENWIDVETRRRTFWLAYTIDRYTSMIDGLHLFFDERMIRTRLPAPESNFCSSRPIEMNFVADALPLMDLDWPSHDMSPFTETVIGAVICGRVQEHKQRPVERTRESIHEFCRRHRSLNSLLAQRIQKLRMYASLEYMDPTLTFTALAAHVAVLTLYDLIESQPLGNEAQAAQLTKALHTEHQQQSVDAVADTAMLVAVLGQHFQTHPLMPILLLSGARFSQSHPGLNDAYNKLMPCIVATLQTAMNFNRLAANFLQYLGPQSDIWSVLT